MIRQHQIFSLSNSSVLSAKHFELNHQKITPDVKGTFVNKTELIEHIAAHADISKAAATRALESTIDAVKATLKKGGSVSLVGFGTFEVTKRAARTVAILLLVPPSRSRLPKFPSFAQVKH